MNKVRIDKWLWAARFYKTRAVARETIQGGKVSVDGVRCKPAKTIEVGQIIKAPRGHDIYEVEVLELSETRRGAPEAQKLYQETPESIERRERESELRRMNAMFSPHPDQKPDKKQRRDLMKFKKQ